MSYLLLLFGIIPVSHNGNGSHGILQFTPLSGADVEVECAQVFLQMRQFCRSRNRYNPRCFLKQPAKSHLCRGHAPCTPESLQRIYNAGIRTHRFRLETRQGLTVVVANAIDGNFSISNFFFRYSISNSHCKITRFKMIRL